MCDGSGRGRRNALVLISVLVVVSVYSVMTRETGPPPELEALHSSEGAIGQCLAGIESRPLGPGCDGAGGTPSRVSGGWPSMRCAAA